MDDASILDTVARATRLREGPAGVAAVLRAVYRAGSLRLQDAAREARLPLPVTTAIRRALDKGDLTRGVTVIESDGRRVEFLRDAARDEGIAIEAIGHDLRNPLPPQLRRAFDVTATDPSYTLAGAKLFLARAAEALEGD